MLVVAGDSSEEMKVTVQEISWHCREGGKNDPILSVHMHPSMDVLVSGGGDHEAKVRTSLSRARHI